MAKKFKSRYHPLTLFFIIFIALSIPLILFIIQFNTDFRQRAAEGDSKPNFLIIMTDDQRADSMHVMPKTVERLGGRGLTFNNFYTTTSLCCPSRSSFFTGLYAHNHGIWTNGGSGGYDKFKKIPDEQIFVQWLHNAGYTTAMIGKYINGYDGRTNFPDYWDDWHVFTDPHFYNYRLSENGRLKKYGRGENAYSTDVLLRLAQNFISTANEPFILVFKPKAPHGDGGEDNHGPAISAPRHKSQCGNLQISVERMEAFQRTQLCSLLAVDEAVDALVSDLETKEKLDNTVVIYTSDNGYSYGEHGISKKNCLYDQCAKVPFIISYPPLTPNAVETDELATNVDLAATIADLAGIQIPSGIETNGVSLKPLLTNPTTAIRDSVLLEVQRGSKQYAIRTKDYKYFDSGKLFDMQEMEDNLLNDPTFAKETENLVNDPAYQATVQELRTKLDTLKQE
jgi:N-acetylglucosamine-6-sulfatase